LISLNYTKNRFRNITYQILINIYIMKKIYLIILTGLILVKKRFIPYPPDEVLIYDNSEMIKNKLKYIIINYNFSD